MAILDHHEREELLQRLFLFKNVHAVGPRRDPAGQRKAERDIGRPLDAHEPDMGEQAYDEALAGNDPVLAYAVALHHLHHRKRIIPREIWIERVRTASTLARAKQLL